MVGESLSLVYYVKTVIAKGMQCSAARLTLRHLLEGANDAIPTGWLLVSDEYSQLVLVKLTMQGLEETGAKVM